MAGDEDVEIATDDLFRTKAFTYEKMSTFVSNYNKQENKTLGYVEARLMGWERYWTTAQSCHDEILNRANSADRKKKYFTEDLFSKYEAYYYTTKGALMDLKNRLAPTNTTPNRTKKSTECKFAAIRGTNIQWKFIGLAIVQRPV